MKNKLLKASAISLILLSSSANATEVTSEQLKALQEQIIGLQAQVNKLQKQLNNDKAEKIVSQDNKLEERLNLLERKQEIAEEVNKNNSERFGSVEFGKNGLVLTGADKRYQFRAGAYGQADNRKYFGNERDNADQFLIRSARPTLDFRLPNGFSGRIVTDFGSNQTRLIDAYSDWKYSDAFTLRLGKFKGPLGLERWQGETDTLFVERGMTTNLVPFRDIGIGFSGDIIPQTLEYQLTLTNGVSGLGDSNGDSSGSKDFTGRIFTQPFKSSDKTWLQGLGFGVAGSYGKRDGASSNTELASSFRTTAQNTFFSYNPAAGSSFANGTNTKINPQAWYYNGPLSLIAEYVKEDYEISNTTNAASVTSLTNDAWTIIGTYVLTGEDASFATVKPFKDFNPEKGDWGAFEVAARYGVLNVDDKTFPTFSNPATSAKSIEEKVIGLNWYINQNLKANLNFSLNSFEGGSATGNRPDEKAILTRLQFKF